MQREPYANNNMKLTEEKWKEKWKTYHHMHPEPFDSSQIPKKESAAKSRPTENQNAY